MDISICLTTHNREEECINSLLKLLAQKTDKIEIILLNDYHLNSENLFKFCLNNQIGYIWTGSQKNGQYIWRMPGFALNIGAKHAKADYLIIGNAEILHTDNSCISKMYQNKEYISSPKVLGEISEGNSLDLKVFNNLFPYLWGFPKEIFLKIGGYDEDFSGIAFDDADLSDRMLSLLKFVEIDSTIVHLWNPHIVTNQELYKRWLYNKTLYETKKGIIRRNDGKDWGSYVFK